MICLSIAARTTEEALFRMRTNADLADLVELRIDGIRDLDLKRLLTARSGPVLVTNRSREEGGAFPGTEQERVEWLGKAVAMEADYVDLEVRTDPDLARGLTREIARHGSRTRRIASYHDVRGTPSADVLREIFRECCETQAHVVKIVTMAHWPEDNLGLLGLIPLAQEMDRKIIAFCMGGAGRVSRVVAPALGSFLSYVSSEAGSESASGQLTLQEMRQIQAILGRGAKP
jgi:3-dehydroquinate dehydratase type I